MKESTVTIPVEIGCHRKKVKVSDIEKVVDIARVNPVFESVIKLKNGECWYSTFNSKFINIQIKYAINQNAQECLCSVK